MALIKQFDERREFNTFFDFKTDYSFDFDIKLLKTIKKTINRKESIEKIQKYVKYFIIAEQIENGIFEYTLIQSTINKFLVLISINFYYDKLKDICNNLDVNNKKINNKTLYNSIITNEINPYFVAFLTPMQLHPQKWTPVYKKIEEKNKSKNTIIATDLYKCYKCGESKCKASQMQTRGADEPMTIFITCLICYNTFTR